VIQPGAEVLVVDDEGVRIATVRGRLDVFSSAVVAKPVIAGLPSDTELIVLDLEDCEAMDSAGVSALVRLRDQARRRAVDVHVREGSIEHLNPTVASVLRRVLGTEDVVDLRQTDEVPVVSGSPVSSAG
jgi:anti-anti-sigma factor